jgi:hypothetical protein
LPSSDTQLAFAGLSFLSTRACPLLLPVIEK